MSVRAIFAIPGDLATLTGGYGYDRRVLALLPDCGVPVAHVQLPAAFPFPTDADVSATIQALRAAPRDGVLLVDGLAFSALPAAALATIEQRIVALVHHPLGYEAGLTEAQSQCLVRLERAALAHAAHIVVTSAPTRDTLVSDFCVPAARLTVAEPGTDPAARAKGSGAMGSEASAPVLLSVGSIVPRKAFNVLVDALTGLERLSWRLRIVGSLERAPETAAALRAQIAASRVADRIEIAGEMGPDELDQAYAGADIFVLSSLYEGYGMVLAEAMARGLPVICTTGGAAAKTVPDNAGLKVAPGDVMALRDALSSVLGDSALRKSLADAAWQAGQNLPRWRDTTARIARVIEMVAGTNS